MKELEGNPGKRKLNKKEPMPGKGMPDCPKWLLPDAQEEWKRLSEKLNQISVLKTHILNYAKTKDVYVAYRKAGYSKAFFEAHREEITLHKAAKQAFSALGVEKLPAVKQLNEEYAEFLVKKKEAYQEYRKAKQEMTDFATAKYDIERFLNLEKEEEIREKGKTKMKEESLDILLAVIDGFMTLRVAQT